MSQKEQGQTKMHNFKGDPSGTGQPEADPNSRSADLDAEQQRLTDEYTEDGLDEIPPHLTNNPNRNLDKPDIDKPPYS